MRPRDRIIRWLLIAMLVPSLMACSGSGRVDGPVLTSPRPPLVGGSGMEAVVRGTVVFDENTECLFLVGENIAHPVVWPAGASWRVDPPAVALQGHLIEPGMSVRGVGGYAPYENVKAFAGTVVADAAQRCGGPTGADVALFNLGSDVSVVTPVEP